MKKIQKPSEKKTLKKIFRKKVLKIFTLEKSFLKKFTYQKKKSKFLSSLFNTFIFPHTVSTVFDFKDLTPRERVDLPNEVCERYFVGEKLGSGAFGVVFKVLDRKSNPYAVKYVKGHSMMSQTSDMVSDNEIKIMKKVKHVCIIKTIDIIKSHLGACLVLEYMSGGDLLNRILASPEKRLTEEQSRCVFYQMTEAVNYLHNKGITHRDIKPDNVLLKDHGEFTLVKLSDFGLSKLVIEGTYMKSLLGTPTYTAPEVLRTDVVTYTSKVDVWSMGVMLFAMLSGTLPFAEDYGNIHKQITLGRYAFLAECWKEVSQSALKLIKKMLVVQPEIRINVNQIFDSSWMDSRHVGVESAKNIMEQNGGRVTRLQSTLQRVQIDNDHEFACPKPPSKRARYDF